MIEAGRGSKSFFVVVADWVNSKGFPRQGARKGGLEEERMVGGKEVGGWILGMNRMIRSKISWGLMTEKLAMRLSQFLEVIRIDFRYCRLINFVFAGH